jgi:hypothetical protein
MRGVLPWCTFDRVKRREIARSVGFSLLLLVGATATARATPKTEACLDAYATFEKLRDAGDLLGAKRELGACGASTCPIAVQKECIDSMSALEPRIPTVVVVARDDSKHDVADVSVFLDDRPLRTRLDGREVEINPGAHKFRFESAGRPPAVESFLINEREKGRLLEVQLPPLVAIAPPAPSPRQREAPPAHRAPAAPVPVLVYVLGGLGFVALGNSVAFGISGLSAKSDADQCRPTCPRSEVLGVNERFLVADVSLGISIVALAAATYLYLSRPARAVDTTQAGR